MEKKKILFIVSTLEVGGGAERSVSHVCNALSKYHDIEILTFYDAKDEYNHQVPRHSFGDKYVENPPIKLYRLFLKYPKKLKNFLDEKEYDLIISNVEDANLVSKLTKLKYKDFNLWGVIRADFSHPLYKSLVPTYNLTNDRIITVSKTLKEKFKNKIPKVKISSIYNPLDLEKINELKKKKISEKEKKIFENYQTITMTSRFVPSKNQSLVIDSFKEIAKNHEDVRLLLFGKGHNVNKLRKRAEENSIEDKVKIMGLRKNIFPYLYHSDIFALSSLTEGLPRSLIEAMACECICVAHNCPTGPSEVIEEKTMNEFTSDEYVEGKYGYLVPFNNQKEFAKALDHAIREGYHYKEKGKKRAEDFSVEEIKHDWLEEIEKSLNS